MGTRGRWQETGTARAAATAAQGERQGRFACGRCAVLGGCGRPGRGCAPAEGEEGAACAGCIHLCPNTS